MSFQYVTQWSSPNFYHTVNVPRRIIIHHWGADGQSFNGVVRHLCNPASQVSAHFVVEHGKVACLVNCDRVAWHAMQANPGSLGVECRPECEGGDRETVAELIAVLWHWFPVLRNKPLAYHSMFVPTRCPGRWKQHLGWLQQRAAYYYPLVNPTKPGTLLAHSTAQKPAPVPVKPVSEANIEKLAREVIAGKYGNGEARKRALGGNYERVQAVVNSLIWGAHHQHKPVFDVDKVARAVIRGDYGNGNERRHRLGAHYDQVQARVNELLR